MIVMGYYGFTLAVCVSICQSIVQMSKCNWSFTKLGICIDIVGLLMGKFQQILTELSDCDTSIFLFMDDNFSNYQWIFTKLGICIDLRSWFGIVNQQNSSTFDAAICPQHI